MKRKGLLLQGATALFLVVVLSAFAPAGAETEPPKPVDVNKATAEQLAELPGIGEVIAQRIIRHRTISGPFRSVDELVVIRGISRKRLEELRPLVTVTGEKESEEGKSEKKSSP